MHLNSFWTPVSAFNDQPASTSTITMTSDITGKIKPGSYLKYKLSGSYYRGICTAITSNLLTIAGAPLTTGDGDLTELYYTDIPSLPPIKYIIYGAFASTTVSTMLANYLAMPGGDKWYGGKAYLVQVGVSTKGDDTGSATVQPAVNVKIAGNDVLSTALTIPDNAYTQSVVQFITANYDINYGEFIELSVTAASGGTPAHDSKDLSVTLTFVPEL